MLLLIILALVIGAISCLILYARWNYGTLEKLGIPMDKPHFLFGNTLDAYDKDTGTADIEKFKRLGPIYGVYEGRQPQIHICDPELIRLVLAKDSDYFNSKRRIDFRNDFFNEMGEFQDYEKWKAIRHFLVPSVSSTKIKAMSASMVSIIEDFAKRTRKNVNDSQGAKLEKYDMRDAFFVMLTDLVMQCYFSIKIGDPMDSHNHFATIVRKVLQAEPQVSPKLEILALSYPAVSRFIPPFFDQTCIAEFQQIFSQILEGRRKSGEKRKDVVDMCIEAIDKLHTPEYKGIDFNENTVAFQAFSFFLPGEQISTIGASMIYHILKNPEVEKKLYVEVDTFLKKYDGKIEHENLPELTYLTACLNETLRLVPFFVRTERVCTKDWKNEEFGLDIKKGMVMILPIWAANRNPEHFPDPEKYDPERFLSPRKEKLHPYAFTSFGYGPRNCMGIKFSMESLLILSVVMLKNFKFHLRSDSKPVYIPAGLFFAPHFPFYFDVTLR